MVILPQDVCAELTSELSGDIERLVTALMTSPLEYDARCIHVALHGLGTNVTSIVTTLATRSGEVREERFGNDLVRIKMICRNKRSHLSTLMQWEEYFINLI